MKAGLAYEKIEFTVIIAVYNGAVFLTEALRSLEQQSYPYWRAIIVDDGSEDDSLRIAQNWAQQQQQAIQILQHPESQNRGVSASRNLAIQQAGTAWLAFLDQDDVWFSEKLAQQVAFLGTWPQCSVLGCLSELDDRHSERSAILQHWLIISEALGGPPTRFLRFEDFILGCPLCFSGVVVRKSVIRPAFQFSEAYPRFADWILWAQLSTCSSIAILPQRLVRYRLHRDNEIFRLFDSSLGFFELLPILQKEVQSFLQAEQGYCSTQAQSHCRQAAAKALKSWGQIIRKKSQVKPLKTSTI